MSVVLDPKDHLSDSEQPTTLIGRLYRAIMDRVVSLFFPIDARGNPVLPIKAALLVLAGLSVFIFGYRWYTQVFSFTYGLDYFSPEFSLYWMSLFWVQVTALTLALVIGAPAIYFTKPEDPYVMTPERELGIYYLIFTFAAIVGIFAFYVILGLFVEADAAWHQVTIRDTDFTPTHIGLFYLVIPAGAVGAILGLIWMHTRMPDFIGRVSIPLFIVMLAPVGIMPNLGLNEWGHTFFYAEELFAAPIHWGFVVLAWGLFAFAGFILQSLNRMKVLTSEIYATEATDSAEARRASSEV